MRQSPRVAIHSSIRCDVLVAPSVRALALRGGAAFVAAFTAVVFGDCFAATFLTTTRLVAACFAAVVLVAAFFTAVFFTRMLVALWILSIRSP